MNPKVSVIIPIFNMEKFLAECLDTVISQTLKEIEIICIDDGSNDRSGEIIREYAQRDERIVHIAQENQGVGNARNNGIRAAHGEFVAFMDPDDWYPEDNTLELLYTNAVEHQVKICGGSFAEQTKDGLVTSYTGTKKKYTFDEDGLMAYADYQFDYGFQRFIYQTEFLRENDIFFPPYIRFQDPPFFVKAMSTAGQFYAMKAFTYRYRVEAQTINWNAKRVFHYLAGLHDCMRMAADNGLNELFKLSLNRLSTGNLPRLTIRQDHVAPEQINTLLNILSMKSVDELKDDQVAVGDYVNVFCCVQTLFHTKQAAWEADEAVLAEMAERLEQIEKSILSLETEDGEPIKLKSAYPINWYKKQARQNAPRVLREECIGTATADAKPLVSVVIPIYNVEAFLAECLDSIVQQTLENIEIICVNDGTPDNSLAIAMEYAARDPRISVYTQENKGLSGARNTGAEMARGEYVYFMDSDDILEKDALECLYQKASAENLDVVFFNAFSFCTEEEMQPQVDHFNKYYRRKVDYSSGSFTGTELLCSMHENGDYKVSACLQMTRLEHFRANELWFINGILHEDGFFTFKNMLTAQRAGYINRAFFNRRVRFGSIMVESASFARSYGYFITYLRMEKLLSTLQLTMSERLVAMELMNGVLSNARAIYAKIPEEERYTVMALSAEERFYYERYVSDVSFSRDELLLTRERLRYAWSETSRLRERLRQAWDEHTVTKERLKTAWDTVTESNAKLRQSWDQNKELRDKINAAWDVNKQTQEKLHQALDEIKKRKEQLNEAWAQNRELRNQKK